ncbi:helix-turn-helix domain-containing protein [Desulfosoma caldarium]|uniref:Winged helix-turn-helix DNA-binding protein n=1 Tax=Desulfosoma caldarium TaxID=610254 RepID=A0A3N1UEY6_9BACT|nr:winged helix-turn-helix domain-containing protein [Desulfosoma caldarium]ROQ89814.1 hypothetical protein EDC27_2926 [Desulfosoma caldarium]
MDFLTERKPTKAQHKETLKRLRTLRQDTVQRVAAQVKAQKKCIASIKSALRDGPKTVPEIAEATGLSPQETLWWIASLKKYGMIFERDKSGAYFTYGLAEDQVPKSAPPTES